MIEKTRSRDRVLGGQERLEVDAEKNEPLRIAHHVSGGSQDMGQADMRTSRDEQHDIPPVIEGIELRLIRVVAFDLAADALDVLLPANTLGAVVEFDHEIEARPPGAASWNTASG